MSKVRPNPLLPLLGAVIAGIVWQRLFPLPFILLISVQIFLIFFFLYRVRKDFFPQENIILLCALFYIGGAFSYQYRLFSWQTLAEKVGASRGVHIGQVESIEEGSSTAFPYKVGVKIYSSFLDREKIYVPFNLLYFSRAKPSFLVGDIIRLASAPFALPVIEPSLLPSFHDYLLKEGMVASLFSGSSFVKLLYRPAISYKRWIFYARERVAQRAQERLSPDTYDLFASIFLGKGSSATQALMREQFGYWGVSHYLARSGLHVVLFASSIRFFLTFLAFPYFWREIAFLILLGFYSILSWQSISFVRSSAVFALGSLGALLDRSRQFVHLLTLFTITLLLFYPMYLFFLDFQLSFFLTFILAYQKPLEQMGTK